MSNHGDNGELLCTRCGSPELRRSRTRALERPLRLLCLRPYRCRECSHRRYAFAGGPARVVAGVAGLVARVVVLIGLGALAIVRLPVLGLRGIAYIFATIFTLLSRGLAAIGLGIRAIGRCGLAVLNGFAQGIDSLIGLLDDGVAAVGIGIRAIVRLPIILGRGVFRVAARSAGLVWDGIAAVGQGCRAIEAGTFRFLTSITQRSINWAARSSRAGAGALQWWWINLRSRTGGATAQVRSWLSRWVTMVRVDRRALIRSLADLLHKSARACADVLIILCYGIAAVGLGCRTLLWLAVALLKRMNPGQIGLRAVWSRVSRAGPGLAVVYGFLWRAWRALPGQRIRMASWRAPRATRAIAAVAGNEDLPRPSFNIPFQGGIMSTKEPTNPAAAREFSWRATVNWLLVAGIVLALGGNLYQLARQQRLEHDLDLRRLSTQRQIQDVNATLSGVLQQNSLRYDALKDEIQAISATSARQAGPDLQRNDSERSRTAARRQQDVATQLSALRSQLRQDTASQFNQLSSEIEKTDSDLTRVTTQMNSKSGNEIETQPERVAESNIAPAPATPEQEEVAAAKKKKRFWNRLNPFHRRKSITPDGEAVE